MSTRDCPRLWHQLQVQGIPKTTLNIDNLLEGLRRHWKLLYPQLRVTTGINISQEKTCIGRVQVASKCSFWLPSPHSTCSHGQCQLLWLWCVMTCMAGQGSSPHFWCLEVFGVYCLYGWPLVSSPFWRQNWHRMAQCPHHKSHLWTKSPGNKDTPTRQDTPGLQRSPPGS